MKKINRNLGVASIVLGVVGFLVWSGLFIYKSSFITIGGQRSYSLFDDAMISMRYAWNFSHGHGLVWNSGEYIQGYTNLLTVLIMSVATFLLSKTKAVLAIQMFGVVSVLTIAYVNMKIASIIFSAEHNRKYKLFMVLAFFCGLLYYPLNYWSLMGMETGLLSALLLSGVYFAFQYSRSRNNKFFFLFSMVAGLAFLTRNDSLIFFFILWICIYIENFRAQNHNKNIGLYIAGVGIYLIFIIGQLLFQYIYYGEFMPNTYILKMTGMPLLTRLQNGLGFIQPFLKEMEIPILLALLGALFSFHPKKIMLLSLFVVSVLYQVYVGGDPWSYWRIMSPSIPLLLLLCLDSIFSLSEYFPASIKLRNEYLNSSLMIALAVFCFVSINFRFLPEITLSAKPYQVKNNQYNVNIAVALNDILRQDATVGVFWAGTIPYYVDNTAIDFLGKSDAYIAELPPDLSGSVSWDGMNSVPGHNKYDLTYSIVLLKPDFVPKFLHGNQDVYSIVKDDYIKVEYRETTLYLLKNSPNIKWEKLKIH